MKQSSIFKEPLVIFILIGAAIFAADQFWLGDPDEVETQDQIVISENERNILKELFAKQRNRPPTDAELTNLVEAYIRDQVFYREALALGLDQDDAVVRRRLVQKMEFIFGDVATFVEPTDEELQAHYDENRENYRRSGNLELVQVYLNPENHGADLESVSRETLEELENLRPEDPRVMEMGDPIMLPTYVQPSSMELVGRAFGGIFVKEIEQLDTGKWTGPVQSGFGWHLVFILERTDADYPPLEEIRSDLVADFDYQRRTQAKTEAYEKLKERYEIIIVEPGETSKQ